VIRNHETGYQWEKYGCRWLESYGDQDAREKITSFAKAGPAFRKLLPQYDLVHIHTAHAYSFLRKSLFLYRARAAGHKTILHIHAPSPEQLASTKPAWLLRRTLEAADLVVVLAEFWKREVLMLAPNANVDVIPNPVPVAEPRARPFAGRRIFFAGRLTERKGYHDLIEAFAILYKENPELELVLAGHGELDEAKRIAVDNGVEDAVKLPGWVTAEDILQNLRDCDVYCLPSYGEGLPMSVLEAMSNGLPVVTTPVGGLPELIADGENGILVTPGDVRGLASALHAVLDDPDKAAKIGGAARETIAQGYCMEQVAPMLDERYQALLNDRSKQ
jgi:glycosyltransferase involved in cell wall biosynthesis